MAGKRISTILFPFYLANIPIKIKFEVLNYLQKAVNQSNSLIMPFAL